MTTRTPNIIYILADDLGYGDIGCNNPGSKIPTPNIDRLASQGIRFTDAHAGSSCCTPSRYSVLTGRYCWRSRLKRGIVWEYDDSLIEPGRRTVAHLLGAHGYATDCVGKWHLGWEWPTKSGRKPNDGVEFGVFDLERRSAVADDIDFTGRIGGGPVDRGFDSYFGVDVPNFPPYTWFVNDRLDPLPDSTKPDGMYGHAGAALSGWRLEEMIPEFTRRAVDLIDRRSKSGEPFFLYFPLTSPHSPVVPNPRFRGMSGAGNYGDFVCEIDWLVGEVMDALDRNAIADSTLLVFTSDNGPERRTPDDIGVYERAFEYGHFSAGELRGMKRDAWEGGHRVPFVARWPEATAAGVTCGDLVSLSDFMATASEIVGERLGTDEAEDSVSMLGLLRGESGGPTRDYAIHHSCNGTFAVRSGDWVFIDAPSGGENEEPSWIRERRGYVDHDHPGELFDLAADPSQRSNRYGEAPEIRKRLAAILEEAKRASGSRDAGLRREGPFEE